MDRRTFLSILAGSPFVFGFQNLLEQDPAPAPDPKSVPDWYLAALKRMKETRRYGVVLVIPPGRKGQVRLGEAILARLSRPEMEDNEIFCEVVFLCLPEAQAVDIEGGPLKGDRTILDGVSRLLLNPDGMRVAGDRIDLRVLETRFHFRKSFDEFVHGEDGERLSPNALEIEKTLPPEVLRARDRMTQRRPNPMPEEDRLERWNAFTYLKERVDVLAPWLANHTKRGRGEGSFRVLLWQYFLDQSELDPEPCLPFGVRVKRVHIPPPVNCTIPRIRGTANRFLGFLEK